MELTDSTETIVVSKASGTGTTDPECVVYYVEMVRPQGERVEIPSIQRSQITGTGDIEVLTGPDASSSARRVVQKLWIYNRDSGAHTFDISHSDGGTKRRIKRVILDIDESLEYTDGC